MTAFGADIDRSIAATVMAHWRAGCLDDLPELRFVSDGVLSGAAAAYARQTHTMLLAAGWARRAEPADVVRALLEEIGHGLDAQLNVAETPGDEGAIFAALVMGDELSPAQIAALRAEDDSRWIVMDGRALQVECSFTAGQVASLQRGFGAALGRISGGFDTKVLNENLPMFGQLAGAGDPDVPQETVLKRLNEIVFQTLGATGQLGAPGPDGTWTGHQVATALNTALFDAALGRSLANVTFDEAASEFVFGGTIQFEDVVTPLSGDKDLGLNGLMFTADGGNAVASFSYTVDFRAGLDTNGLYIRSEAGPEITFNVAVDAAPAGATANANLDLGAQIKFGDTQIFDVVILPTTQFNATFAVDFVDRDGNGKLYEAELPIDYGFLQVLDTGRLDLDLKLETGAAFDDMVHFATELHVDWNFATDASSYFGAKPTVTLTETKLDFSSLLETQVMPFIETVRQTLEPIRKVLDVLRADIPALSGISFAQFLDTVNDKGVSVTTGKDGTISLLDIFKWAGAPGVATATNLIQVLNVVDAFHEFFEDGFDESGMFAVGDLTITSDIRDASFELPLAQGSTSGFRDVLTSFIDSKFDSGDGSKIKDIFGTGAGKVFAPMLGQDGGSAVMSYLFGRTVDILTFDLPKLDFSFGSYLDENGEFTGSLTDVARIPIFMNWLGFELEAAIRASIDVDFGYDSRGLRQYIQSAAGGLTPDQEVLLKGLYVTDWGPNGQERPEVILGAKLNMGGGFGIDRVGKFFAGGSVEGRIELDIKDGGDVDDGRVYYDEFASGLDDPLSLFEGSGLITAYLTSYVESLIYNKEWNSPAIVLGDFTFGEDAPGSFNPQLARLLGGDDPNLPDALLLHIGPNAGSRATTDQFDGSETVYILKSGATRLKVSSFGHLQSFALPDVVKALGGAERDVISVDPNLVVAADLDGGAGEDVLFGGGGGDTIKGGADGDYLWGDLGADQLDGQEGDDTLVGGSGADTLRGGAGIDLVSYASAGAAVAIDLATGQGSGGDAEGDRLFDVEHVIGSDIAGAGDRIESAPGDPTANRFSGMKGDDTLKGGGGGDTLVGGEGHDLLDGGAGSDTLSGGGGDDTYVVDAAADVVDDDLYDDGGGRDRIVAALDYSLVALGDIEELELTGAARRGEGNALDNLLIGSGRSTDTGDQFHDVLSGLGGNDTLKGGKGDDSLEGGDGLDLLEGEGGADTLKGGGEADTLKGGAGRDSLVGGGGADRLEGGADSDDFVVDDTTDVVIELVGEGDADAVSALVDFALAAGSAVEFLRASDVDAVTTRQLQGNEFRQTIVGDAGDNVLEGMGEADSLTGGAGYDTASYEHASAAVTLDFSSTFVGTGDAAGDVFSSIEAFRGSNLLAAGDILTGSDNADAFHGLGGADRLNGRGGGDSLFGGAGDDTLDGGAGDDTLSGGSGDDVYRVDSLGDVVDDDRAAYQNGAGGRDRIVADLDYSLGASADRADIEELELVGLARIGTGNTLDNLLIGTEGADTLDGASGADTMVGGAGDDLYFFSGALDRVVETAGAGADEIRIAGAAWKIQGIWYDPYPLATIDMRADWLANVENLILDNGYRITVIGNDRNNRLVGNSWDYSDLVGGLGDDTLVSLHGRHTVSGGEGFDTLVVDWSATDRSHEYGAGAGVVSGTLAEGYSGNFNAFYDIGSRVEFSGIERFDLTFSASRNDDVTTGDGDDIARGLGGNDHLRSAGGNDTVEGGEGDDWLDTGIGIDVVEGGTGNDRWQADQSALSAGQGLVLDLNQMDVQATYLGAGSVRGVEMVSLTTGAGADSVRTLRTMTSNTTSFGFDDQVTTGAGADTVEVFGGRDVVTMGANAGGLDTLVVDWSLIELGVVHSHPWFAAFDGTLAAGYSGTYAAGDVRDRNRVDFSGVERFVVKTGAGNDAVRTGDGDDTVSSGAGHDHLITGAGVDVVDGGAGSDRWEADKSALSASQALVLDLQLGGVQGAYAGSGSVSGVEMLSLTTGAGADHVRTFRTVLENTGTFGFDDVVTTGGGADTVEVFGGRDVVAMGANAGGLDTLVVDWSLVDLGVLHSHPWFAAFDGTLAGGYSGTFAANDVRDRIRVDFSGVERFVVKTGAGNDAVRTGDGDDTVSSGAGHDHLITGAGVDVVDGGAGSDRWEADKSALSASQALVLDLQLGGVQGAYAGSGSVSGIEMVSLTTGAGADHVRTFRTVLENTGTFGFDDVVTTGEGADTVEVFGGRDVVAMGANAGGLDTLVVDWSLTNAAMYQSHPWFAAFSGSLATGYAGTFATGDPRDSLRVDFSGVERFVVKGGTSGEAIRTGDAGDTLSGGGGADHLSGFGGADLLIGGSGADVLIGGADADTFQFVVGSLDGSFDVVSDYRLSEGDIVDLSPLESLVASGRPLGDVLRIQENPDRLAASVTLDRGPAGAPNWVKLADLASVKGGDQVQILFGGQSATVTTIPPVGSITIGDVSISEGDSGTKTATFTVTRAGGTAAFSVDYATADGSATAGSDFAPSAGTLSFAAGQTTAAVQVTINGDVTVEGSETFVVNLSRATNGGVISDATAIGTITNDDVPGSITIGDVSVTEGDSGAKVATFTVTRTGGSTAFSVNYATADGSATAGSDFVASAGTVSFAAGQTTSAVEVTINGDTAVEGNETFFVTLSGATNGATIADGSAIGTITNDDLAGSITIGDVSISEGDSGAKVATFTVTRAGGSAAFNVSYATTNGSASAGSDFVASSGTLSFAAGQTTAAVQVTINGDATVEGNETFSVNLSGATNGGVIADATAIGTITNDDVAGSISIGDVSITEGDSGTKVATFTVARTGGTATFNVSYAMANGSATAGSDYVASSGTLSFAAGQATGAVEVTINGDATIEGNETFFVTLSGATNGAAIADGSATGTITNDDVAGSITIGDVSITEGDGGTKVATFTVTRAGGAAPFSVNYATADGSAAAGSDYVAASGALSFGAGVNTQTIQVSVRGDTTFEAAETFSVLLSGATSGATILDGAGVVTIANDDARPIASRAATHDFNADMRSDILLQNTQSGAAYVWTLNGHALIDNGYVGWAPGAAWAAKGTGDFNGDGRSDVLLQDVTTGACFTWELNGRAVTGGGFVGWTPGANWQARGTGDFNGDGRSGVLLQNSADGACYIWELNGTSLVEAGAVGWAPGAGWQARGTGDFNGDGRSDILLQNTIDGACFIWELDGTRLVGSGFVGWAPGAAWEAAGTGDFNGDGRSDILLQNTIDGACFIWELDGTRLVGSGFVGWTPGAAWEAVGTGDFNGDGRSDVALQDAGSGAAFVWELDGTRLVDYGPVGWAPGAEWDIRL